MGERPGKQASQGMAGPIVSSRLSNDEIRAILAALGPQSAIAERFGVSQATVSRIKRGVVQVKENGMADEPALEGGIIVPSPPETAETEPRARELAEGEVNVECLARNVHLGNGKVLSRAEIGTVPADVAALLEAKGLARRV